MLPQLVAEKSRFENWLRLAAWRQEPRGVFLLLLGVHGSVHNNITFHGVILMFLILMYCAIHL